MPFDRQYRAFYAPARLIVISLDSAIPSHKPRKIYVYNSICCQLTDRMSDLNLLHAARATLHRDHNLYLNNLSRPFFVCARTYAAVFFSVCAACAGVESIQWLIVQKNNSPINQRWSINQKICVKSDKCFSIYLQIRDELRKVIFI